MLIIFEFEILGYIQCYGNASNIKKKKKAWEKNVKCFIVFGVKKVIGETLVPNLMHLIFLKKIKNKKLKKICEKVVT